MLFLSYIYAVTEVDDIGKTARIPKHEVSVIQATLKFSLQTVSHVFFYYWFCMMSNRGHIPNMVISNTQPHASAL